MTNKQRGPYKQEALPINQRNLYAYVLYHKRKHRRAPCFVPRMPMQSSRLPDYLRAIEALEERGLIKVDRSAPVYTSWIISLPQPIARDPQWG